MLIVKFLDFYISFMLILQCMFRYFIIRYKYGFSTPINIQNNFTKKITVINNIKDVWKNYIILSRNNNISIINVVKLEKVKFTDL